MKKNAIGIIGIKVIGFVISHLVFGKLNFRKLDFKSFEIGGVRISEENFIRFLMVMMSCTVKLELE